MAVLAQYVETEAPRAPSNGVRLQAIGRRDRRFGALPPRPVRAASGWLD
jgi:hypothetical protein